MTEQPENTIDNPEQKSEFQFGDRKIAIDPLQFPPFKCRKICELMAELRSENSLFLRTPREPGESKEDWQKRIRELEADDMVFARENESAIEHKLRVLGPVATQYYDWGLKLVNKALELQGDLPLERDQFETPPWQQTQKFIFDTFNRMNIYLKEYEYSKR